MTVGPAAGLTLTVMMLLPFGAGQSRLDDRDDLREAAPRPGRPSRPGRALPPEPPGQVPQLGRDAGHSRAEYPSAGPARRTDIARNGSGSSGAIQASSVRWPAGRWPAGSWPAGSWLGRRITGAAWPRYASFA